MTNKTAPTLPTVGIYGLGIMGGTMAEALLKHGYKVCGFDIDAKAKQRFKKHGGQFLPRLFLNFSNLFVGFSDLAWNILFIFSFDCK